MRKIMEQLIEFRDERNWEKDHIPEELARAIIIEASELNELFLWGNNPSLSDVADEIADIMIFSLNFCIAKNIDPYVAIERKIKKNAEKYPA